jgi:uncharacterized protein
MNRRIFLKAAIAAVVPAPIAAASYGLFEASWVQIERPVVQMPQLPRAFDGLRVAFLTDIHHGPFTSLDFITSVVRTTLTLQPDVIVLGGDYSYRDVKYIRPCFEVLSKLQAPLGVFGVLGNHDYKYGLEETRSAMAEAGVVELTNAGLWLKRRGARLRLGGVDDLWYGQPDARPALGDATAADACLLVSHNPDFAETLRDHRVGLVLSGHTHGGQGVVPGGGAPFVPSRYGEKYLKGLVEAPATTVYISRGLGTVAGPMRYNSRPELTLLTLRAT